jgi:hypothetical protein
VQLCSFVDQGAGWPGTRWRFTFRSRIWLPVEAHYSFVESRLAEGRRWLVHDAPLVTWHGKLLSLLASLCHEGLFDLVTSLADARLLISNPDLVGSLVRIFVEFIG